MPERPCITNATPELAVFASAATALLWAVILSIPGESLATPDFLYLYVVSKDKHWAVIFFLVSGLQFWRLIARTGSDPHRLTAMADVAVGFCAAMVWTFVSALCLVSQWPPSPFGATTAVLAAGVWWDFLSYHPPLIASAGQQTSASVTPMRKAC